MRLVGALTEGSGIINEDGCGVALEGDEVVAAWIFDGVTGVNPKSFMPAASDATWMVERAHEHLESMAVWNRPLDEILKALVAALEADWKAVSKDMTLPADYDPPGACLVLAKKYPDAWKALRLGDCSIIVKNPALKSFPVPRSGLNDEEEMLIREAKKRRELGNWDIKALLKEFREPILASRRRRNTNAGISVLVAGPESFMKPEYLNLGWPSSILLCTDGYYRAVDYYGLHDNGSLLEVCLKPGGSQSLLREIRTIEASDPECRTYLRFKPADDATVVVLAE